MTSPIQRGIISGIAVASLFSVGGVEDRVPSREIWEESRAWR